MAAFTGNDLRKWREAQQISAADLAERISCGSYRKLHPDFEIAGEAESIDEGSGG